MHVEDHPVEYGHFEGIIPKGEYGGGTVMLWDEGIWIPMDENPTAAYKKGHLKFILKAKKLKGEWNLIRLHTEDKKSWLLIKGKDKYVKPFTKYDITLKKPKSVKTNLTLEKIAKNANKIWTNHTEIKKNNLPSTKMPTKILPQLATLVAKPPEGNEWIHEIKFDGYRIVAFKNGNDIKLISRNGKDWTLYFNNVVKELKKIKIKNCIFDGEIVLLDKKQKSNFQLLQNSIGLDKPYIYYIFDLLYYDKNNLRSLPLIERKQMLKKLVPHTDKGFLRYSDHIVGSGSKIFNKSCKMGLEGIICKKINSVYEEKRTKTWLKVKCINSQEFVIGGFTLPQGSREYFGSLYLGYYDKKGKLIYCGNVGTGFNHKTLKAIYLSLKKIIRKKNPFATNPPGVTSAIWVEPKVIAEVEFIEWTLEGMLRHPSFKGIRMDKPARKIKREKK